MGPTCPSKCPLWTPHATIYADLTPCLFISDMIYHPLHTYIDTPNFMNKRDNKIKIGEANKCINMIYFIDNHALVWGILSTWFARFLFFKMILLKEMVFRLLNFSLNFS